jgi:hypothetical protein
VPEDDLAVLRHRDVGLEAVRAVVRERAIERGDRVLGLVDGAAAVADDPEAVGHRDVGMQTMRARRDERDVERRRRNDEVGVVDSPARHGYDDVESGEVDVDPR